MATTFLAMLTIAIIFAVARYYGSSSLAINLLLTLAFSVVVGLGIQFATKKSEAKKITKVEQLATTNSSSMLPVSALEPDTCQSGVTGKMNNYNVVKDTTKGVQQQVVNPLPSFTRGAPPFPDSS